MIFFRLSTSAESTFPSWLTSAYLFRDASVRSISLPLTVILLSLFSTRASRTVTSFESMVSSEYTLPMTRRRCVSIESSSLLSDFIRTTAAPAPATTMTATTAIATIFMFISLHLR